MEKKNIAHSLGNMLTSAAIQDHNAPVDVYFALNGAVPLEAYDESEANTEQSANNFMLHPHWRDYKMKTLVSKFFQGTEAIRSVRG